MLATMIPRASVVLSLLVLASAPVAAQQDPFAPAQPQPVPVEPQPVPVEPQPVPVEPQPVQVEPQPVEPVFAPQPVQDPTMVPVEPEPVRLVRQVSAYLTIPIFLTNTDLFKPGVGVTGRFGWEFAYLVPEVLLGIQINGTDDRFGSTLQGLWLSLGVRLQILNASRFVPFFNAAIRFNYWGLAREGETLVEYVFEPGIVAGAGLAIELTQHFGLEVAVNTHVTLPTSTVFDGLDPELQVSLLPWVGGTIYF